MKIFLRVIVCTCFFISGIAFSRFKVFAPVRHFLSEGLHPILAKVTEATEKNDIKDYYDFVMQVALKEIPIDAKRKAAFDQIGALCLKSSAAFDALINSCEDTMKPIPQNVIVPLQQHGFVDASGKVNSDLEALKILKEMILHFKVESGSPHSQITSNTIALRDFFKLLTKSFVTKEKGFYEENLLDFKFSFPCYRDLLQLFSESFLEKDYYFITMNARPFIIDCGSNLGMSIIFFKMLYPKAEILAFEPSHTCLPFLKKNIKDNNLDSITLIDKAVSNKKGICFFHEHATTTLGSHLCDNLKSRSTISVDSVPLSEYIKRPVDFVKIDIEGAEVMVLEDLNQSKKIKFIKEICIECHSKNIVDSILKILNKNAFIYQVKREDMWGDAYMVHAFNRLKNNSSKLAS